MVDDIFEHPRLVGIYDALDPDRSDLEVYVDMVDELGADRCSMSDAGPERSRCFSPIVGSR